MVEKQKSNKNPKNQKDGKCFHYAITVALNHQYINNHPKELYNIIPYMKQYDWIEIEFPSHKKDWI